jgi:hypothetical protein
MQSGLERGSRYFKVSPIKAFRDIRHVSVDKVFSTDRKSDEEHRSWKKSVKAGIAESL